MIRKRGTDIVTPPHSVEIPAGQTQVQDYLVSHTYYRTLWIVAENNSDPIERTWVIADRDGNPKRVIVSTDRDLPTSVRKLFGLKPKINKWKIAHIVQGNYGYGDGYEDEYETFDRKDAHARLKEYRANGGGAYRLIRRKVLNPEWEAIK